MAVDMEAGEPYVHPYTLGRRVEDLMEQMKQMKADMETGSAMAAVAYTLTTSLLLDLMPHLMKEHRRMASMVDRDPRACTAVFLRCDRIGDHSDLHEEHFDRAAKTRWRRNSNGHEFTYENW